MLHFRQTFRRPHYLPQALFIKLVGEGSGRTSAKPSAHRNHIVLFSHILMNRVIRETSQREPAAREKNLDLIRTRELANAIEDFAGLFAGQHRVVYDSASFP